MFCLGQVGVATMAWILYVPVNCLCPCENVVMLGWVMVMVVVVVVLGI